MHRAATLLLWIAPRRSQTSSRPTVARETTSAGLFFSTEVCHLEESTALGMSAPYEAYPPPAGVQPFPQPAPVVAGAAPPPYYPPPPATSTAGVQPSPYPAGYPPPPQPATMQPSYNPTYVTAPPSAPPVTVIVQQQPGQPAPAQVVQPPPQQSHSGSSGMGMAGAAAVGMMAGAAVAGVAAAAHSRDRHHHHTPPPMMHRPGLLSRGHHGPVNVHIHPQPTHWAAKLALRARERRHH